MGKTIVIPWNSVSEVQDYSLSGHSGKIFGYDERIKIKSTNGETIEVTASLGGFYRIRKILREQSLKLGFVYPGSPKSSVDKLKDFIRRVSGG